jgi:hypothetical protein
MYAIEFETDVYNNTIQIPEEYKELELRHVKVFIVDVKPLKKTLPDGFYNRIPVNVTFSEIAKRDALYDR